MSRVPNPSYYVIDNLFKSGDLVYDKSNDVVFRYDRKKHYNNIKTFPNNYRKAHKGDKK